jgi:hypothetical protein
MDFQEGRIFFRIEKLLKGGDCVGPLNGLGSKDGEVFAARATEG